MRMPMLYFGQHVFVSPPSLASVCWAKEHFACITMERRITCVIINIVCQPDTLKVMSGEEGGCKRNSSI